MNRIEAKVSGERRAAGKKRWCEVGGISCLSGYWEISGFLVWLLNNRLDRGANRTAANDLAKGAQRKGYLGGVQVCSTRVLNLAHPCNFVMVVKDFPRIEVDFTDEQQAHNEGPYPRLVPIFAPASQIESLALP